MVAIKNYTQDDLAYVVKNFQTMTVKEIANNLNKNPNSIGNAARKLGLVKQPHRNWTDDEIEFLKTNYETMEHKEIGKILGRTTQAITAKCFDLDLYKKELPWEEWELEFLRNNYMGMCKSEIAEILKRTPSAIGLKASRMGFKKYPYFCDYHYFDVIDTEEKAYWLGFLTADGWINHSEKNNAGVVGVELQYGDINHLKKFNKSLNGNYKITDRWRECKLSPYDKKNHFCILRIFSIIMYNSLVKLGFSNSKSYDISIPKIDDSLMRHYIRGYFDGDGCFSLSHNRLGVSFCTSSEIFKNDLINYLSNNGITLNDYYSVGENGIFQFRPEAVSNKEKLKLLDYMYKDSTIYLDRKYKKYLKAKSFYDNQNIDLT